MPPDPSDCEDGGLVVVVVGEDDPLEVDPLEDGWLYVGWLYVGLDGWL